MKGEFLLHVEGSDRPPRYVHLDSDLAIAEAKRLHEMLGKKVLILSIVGKVETVQVPVTKPEVKVTFEGDDLPF